MALPKQNFVTVMDTLPPADRVTLANLETHKSLITCPKCTVKGTITYTGNTNASTPHPLFSCIACKQKISISSLQHEITQAKASGAIPIQIPYPTPEAPTTNPTKKTSTQNKHTRVESDDNLEMTRSKSTPTKNSKNNTNNDSNSTAILETLKALQQQLEEIKKENVQMKQQIQSANERNAQLEKKILALTKNEMLNDLQQQQQQQQQQYQQHQQKGEYDTRMEEDTEEFPPLSSNNNGSSASKYAHAYNSTMQDKIRKTNIKQKTKNNNNNIKNLKNNSTEPKKNINIAGAIRAFTAPNNDNQGYIYIYYPAKSRISRKQQRSNLKKLGVINGRILDIHYPARNVVALLVHINYKQELIDTLLKSKVSQIEKYDPTNPATITDPQYNSIRVEERGKLAEKKHNERIVRALPFIRHHISRSVAAFFVKEKLITTEQHENFITEWNKKFEQQTNKQKNNTPTPNNTTASNKPATPSPTEKKDESTPRKLNISCINANGKLREEAIDSTIYHCKNTDLLFITETWLPPTASNLPTDWTQYHQYGHPVSNSYRHERGISLFINPNLKYEKLYVDTTKPEYYIICTIDNLKIYCLYLPPTPSLENNQAIQIIESIPLSSNVIICGDLNARMGKVTGDSRWNTRGTKLCKTVREKGIINWNAKLQYKKYTRINFQVHNNTTENSIVDYFLSPNDLQQPTLTIRDDLAILGSDHKLMTLSFILIDHDVATAYITTFNNQIQEKNLINKLTTFLTYLATIADISSLLIENQQNNIDTIEYITEEFYNSIYHSLNTIITEADYRPKNWKWFWNKCLQGRANFRQACYTRWRKSVGFQSGIWWSRYKAADRELKKNIKQARAEAYQKFCTKLDDDHNAAIPIVKRIINSKNKNAHRYTTEEGPQHAVDSMAHYLEGIFDGRNLPQPQNKIIHTTNNTNTNNNNIHTNITETFNTYDFHDCPFQENHIYNAIKRLPNKKSPGSDHITSEMIKPIIDSSTTILKLLFRICWITGYTPELWRQSQIVPIYKGAGDQTMPSNYRPISLTSTFRKVMEYCLQDQLYQQTNFISIQQGGFKPKLSAMDHAVVLDELMHRFKINNNNNTSPAVITLDVAKAYDQCLRETIWNTMW
ncbi:hypothetical protein INT47_004827 [Mucor saturninus]|uniref:Endonuclease/exonuclease/phosphatase domain-containing protein n=1 Tax=Mucor saturninus TaxID=64648 RepID=A0A8H7QFU8_9FUNG|nr:hypothetical protein INT47_004827 [Mucor saturninus]